MTDMTPEEWLARVREIRIDIAKMPDDDPRKGELQAVLSEFEDIERRWNEIDEHDPDEAEQRAGKIISVLRGRP